MSLSPNEIAEKARTRISGNPPLEVALRAAWDRICTKIEERAASVRPKRKVFEVHHETQAARLALLTAIVEGRSPETGETEAPERVRAAAL